MHGQWCSGDGPAIKTHIRRTHVHESSFKDQAASRGSQAEFLGASPCHYCKINVKNPGTHLKSCVVLFQASLWDVLIKDGHGTTDGVSGGHGDEGDFKYEATTRAGGGIRGSAQAGEAFKVASWPGKRPAGKLELGFLARSKILKREEQSAGEAGEQSGRAHRIA